MIININQMIQMTQMTQMQAYSQSIYKCPRLEISARVPAHQITDKIRYTRGEIKDNLDFAKLKTESFIYQNEVFVQFLKDSKNKTFVTLPDFYLEEVKQVCDIYGGIYDIIIDNIKYTISLYFYEFKNPELITKSLIENKSFNLIFKQTNMIEDNILDMDYHSYRMAQFMKILTTPKFYDLTYESNPMCKTPLYRYQRHNIANLLKIHHNGIPIRFNNNLITYFGNGIIYDFVKNTFIVEDDITAHLIKGGIIMDDAGTGKTLQFIIYILEVIMNTSTLDQNDGEKIMIMVPDEDIKKHWKKEFEKHILIQLEDLPIIITTTSEFRKYDTYKKADRAYLEKIKIIIVDEIHTLWKSNSDILDKLIRMNITHRWGLSATPFITEESLFNIMKFITGMNFHNQRIQNIPRIQIEFMKVFFKNTKANTADEYPWPTINFHDLKLTFDKTQQDLYDTEAKSKNGTYNLRLLACQVELMFGQDCSKQITPKELKQYATKHYETIYKEELEKLENLVVQLENIHKNKDKFEQHEYITRFSHYEKLIKNQEVVVVAKQTAYNYIVQASKNITNAIQNAVENASENSTENMDCDDNCPICMNPHESPIAYFKKCAHYFCKSCVDILFSQISLNYDVQSNISCPMCRQSNSKDDILIVSDKCEITYSPKIREIINIITQSSDRFIIFTQFHKLIDNLIIVLQRCGIDVVKYSEYKTMNEKNAKVILLSSEENAAGIDLTEFNNVIVFEPFEDSTYCKEIYWQLVGRVHRNGQTKPVSVYRLIMMGTIEEMIYAKFLE